jgi:3'-phosphoadenosine 5'-phosphosulfate sulfotransferase (PAPS reductase)/FAD synthetase
MMQNNHKTWHIVGFSGGIDSQACALWVRQNKPADSIVLLNSLAGRNEHPLTEKFIADYSRNVFPVTQVIPRVKDLWKTEGFAETKGLDGEEELTFEKLIEIKKRSPSRTQQFCTMFLKLYPSVRWIEENIPPSDEVIRYTGVRRDESAKRSDTPLEEWDGIFDCKLVHPVAQWSKQQCFDFVRGVGEPINPLYTMGFNRVGCAPCINSGKDDILNWATRAPEMIDKVRGIEARTGRTFFSPKIRNGVPNSVDDVVEWAKTDRGGKEVGLRVLYSEASIGSCSSKYGLCE